MAAKTRSKIFDEATYLDKSAFHFRIGLRAAIFVVTPMVLRIVLNYPLLTFSCLGALFLINTEWAHYDTLILALLIACFTEAAAWALGTLAGTAGFLAPLLVGIFVFAAVTSTDAPGWTPVGTFTGIIFAVGVGLPGGGSSEALPRAAFALAGSLWALAGVVLTRYIISRSKSSVPSAPSTLPRTSPTTDYWTGSPLESHRRWDSP